MTYKALTRFADLKDGGRVYDAGDVFPRKGLKVGAKRLEELLGSDNRAGRPLIAAVTDDDNAEAQVSADA